MPTPRAILRRAGVVSVAGSLLATSALSLPTAAAAADADLRIIGGNAASYVVCGNVASAKDLADQRRVAIQRSNCTAKATGGSVTLQNVDIYVSSTARVLNRGNAVLAAVQAAPVAPGVATDRCEHHQPSPGPGKQLNKCWSLGRGGRVHLNNVRTVNQLADGRTVTRTIAAAVVPAGTGGSAAAACANVVNHPQNQRDDCTGSGAGGSWSMRGVDVVIRNADGTVSTRRGITVEVRGGTATAGTYCFNVVDGSNRVIQINVCDAASQGGDATLRNVTFYTAG